MRIGSQHMVGCSGAQTLVTVGHNCDTTVYLGVQTFSLLNQLSSQWLKMLIPYFSDSYKAVVDQKSASHARNKSRKWAMFHIITADVSG